MTRNLCPARREDTPRGHEGLCSRCLSTPPHLTKKGMRGTIGREELHSQLYRFPVIHLSIMHYKTRGQGGEEKRQQTHHNLEFWQTFQFTLSLRRPYALVHCFCILFPADLFPTPLSTTPLPAPRRPILLSRPPPSSQVLSPHPTPELHVEGFQSLIQGL